MMKCFDLPQGTKTALIGSEVTLSFDELISLKTALQFQLTSTWSAPPKRVLGCLEDTISALVALLACPELCDYMPVNPRLRHSEILEMARSGKADAAILAQSQLESLGPLLMEQGLQVVAWDEVYQDALASIQGKRTIPVAPAKQQPGRLILHTSGTTGAPKRVPITLPAMHSSAKNIARYHELADDDIALNTLPTFHIGAVVDVLLAPYAAGGRVALTNDRSAQGLHTAICEHRPTWVQIVPTLLLHMIETLSDQQMRDLGTSLRFVRSISAPVPEALRARAQDLLGCPIIEMYGMTETAGQISTNGREPEDRKPGTVGRLGAVPIKILDATGSEVKQGREGEVCVSGPTVFGGYEGVERGEVFFDDWFRTGDLGLIDDQGFLEIKGRLKEMINVGGEKVSPSEIEKAALEFPHVIEAAAYALPHPTLGEVAGLTVAVRKDVDPDTLLDHLRTKVADHKMPRRLQQVAELPRLPNAKVDRLKIARDATEESRANAETQGRTSAQTGATGLTRKIAELWAKELGSRSPHSDDDFFDMGGDSLSATTFLLVLSKALGRDIHPNQLFETPRFGALVEALERPLEPIKQNRHRAVEFVAQKMAGWPGQIALQDGLFRGLATVKNGAPFFWCCTSVAEIEQMRNSFAAKRPVYVVRSLNRLRGKSAFRLNKRTADDFEAVTHELVREIETIQPNGELCLGGNCGGADLMERVAHRLMARGRKVRVFISFDHWPKAPLDCYVLHWMKDGFMPQNQVDAAVSLLHPQGVEFFDSHDKATMTPDVLEPHRTGNGATFGSPTLPNKAGQSNGWTFEQRKTPYAFKVIRTRMPWFYAPGTEGSFTVALKNMSNTIWEPFDVSGLGFQLRLVNFDGCIRTAVAGFGKITQAVEPNAIATVSGKIEFPGKSVPLFCQGQLLSYGIAQDPTPNTRKTLRVMLPRRT